MMKPLSNNRIVTFLEQNYMLLLIILLSAVLRIYHLAAESIWLDEIYTINISKFSLSEIMLEIIGDNENHPPLYYLFMHYWIEFFGDSAFSVRFPSVIFGVMSVYAIYKVAYLLFNKNTALISSLILASSEFSIELSQQARSYSLLIFLSIVSVYFFVRFVEDKSFKTSVLYIVSSIFLIYTHNYAIFIVVSQNVFFFTVYVLSSNRAVLQFKRWIFLQIILFISFLPQIYLILNASALKEGYWIIAPSFKVIPGLFLSYSGSWSLFLLFIFLSLVSVINLKSAFLVKDTKEYTKTLFQKSAGSPLTYIQKIYLLVLWMTIPLLIAYLVSVLVTPVLQYRYLAGGVAAFFILAAKGVESLGNRILTILLAVLILLLSLFNTANFYRDIKNHQWRETISYLESVAGEGDYALVFPDYDRKTGFYYQNRDDIELIALDAEFPSLPDTQSYDFWLIVSRLGSEERESRLYERLKSYNLQSVKEFHKIKLYHFKK